MTFRTPSALGTPSVQRANLIDALAAAGGLQAKRRQAAMLSVASAQGLPAKSATSAAILLMGRLDTKAVLRAEIAEIRDAIDDDRWPTDVVVTNEKGEQVLVTLTSSEQAMALLDALEQRLNMASGVDRRSRLQVQNALRRLRPMAELMGNIKNMQQAVWSPIVQTRKA